MKIGLSSMKRATPPNYHRVLKYVAITRDASDGSVATKKLPFLSEHAAEAGVTLETDGIPIEAAKALIEKWNKRPENGPVQHTYRIPFVKTVMH
jgi:hypothetical protein